jgi:hypothetical protein
VLQVAAGSGGLGDTWFGGGVVVAGFSRELKAEAVRLMADEGLSARGLDDAEFDIPVSVTSFNCPEPDVRRCRSADVGSAGLKASLFTGSP